MEEVVLVGVKAPLRDQLNRLLRATGYRVRRTEDAHAAQHAAEGWPAAMIVDLRAWPEASQIRRWRSEGMAAPIVALAAGQQRTPALEAGATDCFLHPFSVDEVAQRVDERVFVPRPLGARLSLGDRYVDLETNEVVIGEERVRLTPTEARLLRYLGENAGRAIRRAELLTRVFGYRPGVASRTVVTTVQRLRGKIEADPRSPRHLQVVYGIGYRFLAEQAPEASARPAPLFGRVEELTELGDLLATRTRLVSIIGPAGVGKTRLARALLPWSGGASWFCDLSTAHDRMAVLRGVAEALSVSVSATAPAAALGRALRKAGPCLLVLDNVEQVAEDTAALVAGWLDTAPALQVLSTSRVPLRLPAEHRLPLAPLPVPDPEEKDLRALRRNPSVALFVDRARCARPSFALDARSGPHVAAVCVEMDGLPLAIELAASRAGRVPVAEIRTRLKERFGFLAQQRLPARQATLRAALDWSWELLAPWERGALAQLSVFVDGFDQTAAAAVLDLSAWPEAPWRLDVLDALVEHSLVQKAPVEGRAPRFRLLQSVQAYAAEKLAAPQAAEARHGAHYALLGSPEYLAAIESYGGAALIQRLSDEHRNIEAALRRAVARTDAPVAIPTARAAVRTLGRLGPLSVARELCDLVLALPLAPPERISLLGRRSDVRMLAGDSAGAQQDAEEAVALARAHQEPQHLVPPLIHLSEALTAQGQEAAALVHMREALSVAGGEHHRALVRTRTGKLLLRLGRPEEALEHLQAAAESHRHRGAQRPEADTLLKIGILRYQRGQLDLSRVMFERALPIARAVGHQRMAATLTGNLGLIDVEQGRLLEGEARLQEAARQQQQIGFTKNAIWALYTLGRAALVRGDLDEASARLEQASALCAEIQPAPLKGAIDGALVEARARQQPPQRDDAYQATMAAFADAQHATADTTMAAAICRAAGEHALRAGQLAHADRVLRSVALPPDGWTTTVAGLAGLRGFIAARLGETDSTRMDQAEQALIGLGALPELALLRARRAMLLSGAEAQAQWAEVARMVDRLPLTRRALVRLLLDTHR